jgi:medium-chain acyl-[acyl-carrier-protein] hydrolase
MDDLPLALLGYCSGSFAAYQLAKSLAATGRPPLRLIVLASPGPRVIQPHRQVHGLSRPQLLDYLRGARITPESLLADPNLFALFEPAIRADFETYETWIPDVSEPLPLPVTVVGAREDDSVDLHDLLMWQHHTIDEFTLRMLPGGHDFLGAATPRLARTLCGELRPTMVSQRDSTNPATPRIRP